MHLMKTELYFQQFEDRVPYEPTKRIPIVAFGFKIFGLLTIFIGCVYLFYRWVYSINPQAAIFSYVLTTAETLSFVGTILMIYSFWDYDDHVPQKPVHYLSEIQELNGSIDRPVKIDVFIATYNEQSNLLKFTINDAKNIQSSFNDVQINIYVLDDGRRDGRDSNKENIKKLAEDEKVHYLTRECNEGFKAGNLANGLLNSDGDLFLILDADTRVFPTIIQNVSGYFKNKNVAWVQTPQWFFDLTPGEGLDKYLVRLFKLKNKRAHNILNKIFGWVKVNEDVFGNDSQLFYDVIQRKRNLYNASFCCGAGSLHRREAVMSFAISEFKSSIESEVSQLNKNNLSSFEIRKRITEFFLGNSIKPFVHHASEDLYTSVYMHSNKQNKWISLLHPKVECKMLSTQDLNSRTQQYSRYAEGTLDLGLKKNFVFMNGLSLPQRLCYLSTLWSYLSPLWIIIFVFSPIYYFFTLTNPVLEYNSIFSGLFVLFQILNTTSFVLGTWGINNTRSSQYFISGFWFMLKALFKSLFSSQVKFNVTPKSKENSNFFQHIIPHLLIIGLALVGIVYNSYLIIDNRHPDTKSFFINLFWCLFNLFPFLILINAVLYQYSHKDRS
jgi:cellulose synthase (UDP-forming)